MKRGQHTGNLIVRFIKFPTSINKDNIVKLKNYYKIIQMSRYQKITNI